MMNIVADFEHLPYETRQLIEKFKDKQVYFLTDIEMQKLTVTEHSEIVKNTENKIDYKFEDSISEYYRILFEFVPIASIDYENKKANYLSEITVFLTKEFADELYEMTKKYRVKVR